jgi:hypothetical protein
MHDECCNILHICGGQGRRVAPRPAILHSAPTLHQVLVVNAEACMLLATPQKACAAPDVLHVWHLDHMRGCNALATPCFGVLSVSAVFASLLLPVLPALMDTAWLAAVADLCCPHCGMLMEVAMQVKGAAHCLCQRGRAGDAAATCRTTQWSGALPYSQNTRTLCTGAWHTVRLHSRST